MTNNLLKMLRTAPPLFSNRSSVDRDSTIPPLFSPSLCVACRLLSVRTDGNTATSRRHLARVWAETCNTYIAAAIVLLPLLLSVEMS